MFKRIHIKDKPKSNTSGKVGVYWFKLRKKWRAEICDIDTHKGIHLGLFDDIDVASESYKEARKIMVARMKEKVILKYGITDTRVLDAIK